MAHLPAPAGPPSVAPCLGPGCLRCAPPGNSTPMPDATSSTALRRSGGPLASRRPKPGRAGPELR
eukprot:5743220-Lingulodinium_polyedra.AAC.1